MGMAKNQLPGNHANIDLRRPQWAGRQYPQQARGRYSAPTCELCGSRNVRAFAAIYGQGTSTSVTLRGRVFRRGYTRSRRQSVLAQQCAPPRKQPYWPSFALTLLAGTLTWAAGRFNIGNVTDPIVTVALIGAAVNLAVAGIYNLRRYPEKMNEWGRSYYCFSCGGKSRLC